MPRKIGEKGLVEPESAATLALVAATVQVLIAPRLYFNTTFLAKPIVFNV